MQTFKRRSARIQKNETELTVHAKRRQEEREAYAEAERTARESTLRRSTRARKPVKKRPEYDHQYQWSDEDEYTPSSESSGRKRKRVIYESPNKKPKLSQDNSSDSKQYVVKAISRHRFWRGREQFFVSWKRFDSSWEDGENVKHCAALKEYVDREKAKGSPWAQVGFVPPARIESDLDESSDEEGSEGESSEEEIGEEPNLDSDFEGEEADEDEEDGVAMEVEENENLGSKKGSSRHFAEAKKEYAQIRADFNQKRLRWLRAQVPKIKAFLDPKGEKRLEKVDPSPPLQPFNYLLEQPQCLEWGTLRDYQLNSVNFVLERYYNGASCILGDEMGLGKTIQTIAVLAHLWDQGIRGPHLVVCPLSVSENWMDEIKRWLPCAKVKLYHSTSPVLLDRIAQHIKKKGVDIVVTTYERAVASAKFLQYNVPWRYIVYDEAHRLKSETTILHNTMQKFPSTHVLFLTGTPIQNNMHELWALLHFLNPDVFVESDLFDKAFEHITQTEDKNLLKRAPVLLKPFMIRRIKKDVETGLPPKEEIIVSVPMAPRQVKYYKTLLAKYAGLMDEVNTEGDRRLKKASDRWQQIRHLWTELRNLASHPFLASNEPFHPTEDLVTCSGKMLVLDKLCKRLKARGSKILLFSVFLGVLDLMEAFCELRKYKYLRLDGSTHPKRRRIDIARFSAPDSDHLIYLISNRAGGLGLNLQVADTVVHFDTDWNPQADLQAQARAHRIGQKKEVKVYRLISKDTVEERILFRAQQKLYLDAIVNGGSRRLDDSSEGLDLQDRDLLRSIKFGAQKMFQAENYDGLQNFDLDALISGSTKIREEKGQADAEGRQSLMKKLNYNVEDFDFSMALLTGTNFQGRQYKKKQHESPELVIGRRKRKCRVKKQGAYQTLSSGPTTEAYFRTAVDGVWDTKRYNDLKHQDTCIYCKEKLHENEEPIHKCNRCPRAMHQSCIPFDCTNCPAHMCSVCKATGSQASLFATCLACTNTFCYRHLPEPKWLSSSGDGCDFQDGCAILEHYSYKFPKHYIALLCSERCNKHYHEVMLKEPLPDLDLKISHLPKIFQDVIHHAKPVAMQRIPSSEFRVLGDIGEELYDLDLDDRIKNYIPKNCELESFLINCIYPDLEDVPDNARQLLLEWKGFKRVQDLTEEKESSDDDDIMFWVDHYERIFHSIVNLRPPTLVVLSMIFGSIIWYGKKNSGRYLRLSDSKKHVACALSMFLVKPNVQLLQIPHEWVSNRNSDEAFRNFWHWTRPPPPKPKYNTKFNLKPQIPTSCKIPTLNFVEYMRYWGGQDLMKNTDGQTVNRASLKTESGQYQKGKRPTRFEFDIRKLLMKDPNGPRKPVGGYQQFCLENSEDVARTTRSGTGTVRLTPNQLHERWKGLTSLERQTYNNRAEIERQQWLEDLERYKSTAQFKAYLRKSLQTKMNPFKPRPPAGNPKKPKTVFYQFQAHMLQTGELDDSKDANDMWRDYPPMERHRWEKKAAASFNEFEKMLNAYRSSAAYQIFEIELELYRKMKEYTDERLDETVDQLVKVHNETAVRKEHSRRRKVEMFAPQRLTSNLVPHAMPKTFFNPPRIPKFNTNVGKKSEPIDLTDDPRPKAKPKPKPKPTVQKVQNGVIDLTDDSPAKPSVPILESCL